MKTRIGLMVAVLLVVGQWMSRGQVAELTVPLGGGLREFMRDIVPQSDAVVQLLPGTYTTTPSILASNLSSGNQFTGITLANKTNITILGTPGQTIIDGSSAIGDVIVLTNCDRITIRGVSVIGYTNHNYTQTPLPTGRLHAGITVIKVRNLLIDNCIIERHYDHGIADGASGYVPVTVMSTNNVVIRGTTFRDIGSYWTNGAGGWVRDGTAIVPTGWTIENCYFEGLMRGIEPYTDVNGANQVFVNCIIRNNTFRNIIEFGISGAGETNGHNIQILNNSVVNDYTFSYKGTNYGGTTPWQTYAYWITGGRGHQIIGNQASGGIYTGFYLGNAASGVHDVLLMGNSAFELNPGVSASSVGFDFGDNANTALAANSLARLVAIGNTARGMQGVGFNVSACRDCLFESNYSIRHTGSTAVDPIRAGFRIGSGLATTHKLTNVTLRGNVAIDGGVGSAYGFSFYTGAAGSNVVFVENRAFGFAMPKGMTNNSGGTFTVVGEPVQARLTFDLPSVAAQAQFQTNAALFGATTNTFFNVEMPLPALQGVETNLIANAWGSNNTVYVVFRNVGNVAVDAAQREFTVTGMDTSLPGR